MHLFTTAQRDTTTTPAPARSPERPTGRTETREPFTPSDATAPSRTSDRTQVVAEILQLCRGVSATWLEQFDDSGLSLYLQRLRDLAGPDCTGLRPWVRVEGEPAIIGRVVRA